MPALDGDAPLVTFIVDVHYFFGDPNQKPPHHRFDKGSYLYLFFNPTGGRARVQIANNTGSQDQDSFTGGLETCDIVYSHRRTNLFTITPSAKAQPEAHHWKLPAFEPYGKNKYLYPVRAVDVYLWTPKDAGALLEAVKGIASVASLDIQDLPTTPASPAQPKQDPMVTPLVAKLERAAIASSTPQETLPSSASRAPASQNPAAPAASEPRTAQTTSPPPAPYNPASPGAPEPIAHREKTPPPLDAEPVNAGFSRSSTGASHPGPGLHRTSTGLSQTGGSPGLSRTNTGFNQSFAPQHSLSFAAGPTSAGASPSPYAPYGQYAPQAQAQAQAQAQPSPQGQSPYFAPPPISADAPGEQQPGMPPGGGASAQPQPQQHVPLSRTPPGGYSSYAYPSTTQNAQQQFHQQPPTYSTQQAAHGYMAPQAYSSQQQQQPPPHGYNPHAAYAAHQQLYRPTEAEARHGAVAYGLGDISQDGRAAGAAGGEASPFAKDTKLFGVRLDRAEKGVNSFLRKLDKRS